MARVDFYHGADNKLSVAARLAQKAILSGARMGIYAPEAELSQRLDRTLWTFTPLSFVAHAHESNPIAGESPIVILQKISSNATFGLKILINMDVSVPDGSADFDRLIEIVGQEEEDIAAARLRYKAYRDLGYELFSHRLGQDE